MSSSHSSIQKCGPSAARQRNELNTADKSLPVFDLRRGTFAKPHFQKISLRSLSKEEIQNQVAQQFEANPARVLVLESQGRKEETLRQTLVIVQPDYDPPSKLIVLIEMFEALEQTHPQLGCLQPIRPVTVGRLVSELLEEAGWKAGTLCMGGDVLSLEASLQELAAAGEQGDLCRVQLVKSMQRHVSLVYQPVPDVSYTYTLHMDVSASVKKLKSTFQNKFKNDLLMNEVREGQVIHINFQQSQLQDSACLGMVLRGSKDDTFSLHIAVPNAVSINLKYRVQHGKTRVPHIQQVLIRPNCSTQDLRVEAAKYLKVDRKAVKLAINDKRIEEDDNLQTNKILMKGVTVTAGVKKKKTVLVRHPVTGEEFSVSLYLLETVHVLKVEIGSHFTIEPLQISLRCRGMEMRDKDLLINYPIKNKMELAMEIFDRRITVLVWIIFKKVKARLVIDDVGRATVDDLLTFCAIKYRYSRHHSKALFQQRCLNKRNTLAQEGLQSGCVVHVVFFDNTEIRQDNLINIFMAREDGHIVQRLGSICGGLLLHGKNMARSYVLR